MCSNGSLVSSMGSWIAASYLNPAWVVEELSDAVRLVNPVLFASSGGACIGALVTSLPN